MALELDIVEAATESLITVRGEVDLYTSPRLRAAVLTVIPKARGPVGVDLAAVKYMDSSGVATLIEGLRAAEQKKTEYVLIAPSRPVMKVLELARLTKVFSIRKQL